MKIYTYSQAREKLADILEESKKEEIVIRRRKGDMFSIVPKITSRRSPFDVPNLGKRIARKEILEAIRESRERKGERVIKGEGERVIKGRGKGHILNIDSAEKPLHKKPGLTAVGYFFFTLLFFCCVVSSTDRPNRLTCSVFLSVKLH